MIIELYLVSARLRVWRSSGTDTLDFEIRQCNNGQYNVDARNEDYLVESESFVTLEAAKVWCKLFNEVWA